MNKTQNQNVTKQDKPIVLDKDCLRRNHCGIPYGAIVLIAGRSKCGKSVLNKSVDGGM